MAKELFEAVQTAEEKAEQILQDAQKQARELIKNTQAEIAQNERSMALEHRALYAGILEQRRQIVADRIEGHRAETEKKQEQTLAAARERLDDAAQRISERVWKDGHR